MRSFSVWLLLLLLAFSARPARAGVDYEQDVRPILKKHCYSCHGALRQKSGLRLDHVTFLRQGGDGGTALAATSAESRLIMAVRGGGDIERMPLEAKPLSEAEIATLAAWVDAGAPAPEEKLPDDPRQHWSFQKPVRPALPAVKTPAWSAHPIDRFVAAEHEQRGLTPVSAAAKNVLLRRVYLDLIGLPPSPEELHAYLADASDDAYERVVDRLLASPQYGERWARHWMDVWRYSDWDGYGAEVRESRPHIWRWRDWIIESLNVDRPYDQMVQSMLAADEIAPEDTDSLRASGYLVRNWYRFNRNVWLEATVEHTSKAFLGITLNCARCHDHMYDPILQTEYYQFRALFEPHDIRTDRVPGQSNTDRDGLVRVFDTDVARPTYLFERGNEGKPDKEHPLAPAVPRALGGDALKIEPVTFSPTAYYPGLRPFEQQETLTQANEEVAQAEAAITKANTALVEARKKQTQLAAAEKPKPPETSPATATKESAPAAAQLSTWTDNFAAGRNELWQLGSGRWEYRDGRLQQSEQVAAHSQITTVPAHAKDFRAAAKFKITGGQKWKSVGLSFDVADEQNFCGVYLSATAGGQKLQIYHRTAGKDLYPAEGSRAMTVELDHEYNLQVSVREQLVNVSVDGQLQLGYRLPEARRDGGRFALWTYDASADFIAGEMSPLPADVTLAEATNGKPPADAKAAIEAEVVDAESAAALAEQTFLAAQASLTATRAKIAADRAAFATPAAADAAQLARDANRAERIANVEQARKEVLRLERDLAKVKPDADAKKKAAETKLAEARKTRDAAQLALGTPAESYTRFGQVYPTSSSGRRAALARWIASRNNPLTARVAINHVWLRHFGSPLVPTVFDFGLNGKAPTHAALLDWLSVELMEQGWQMKPIHRLIVTSTAYRLQSVSTDPNNRMRDPENIYLWRANPRRMEAEVVRDSTLAVAGGLDSTMFGPELEEKNGLTVARRSLYFRSSKEKKVTFLEVFDRANVTDCYRRSETVIPQQALAMVNSSLTLAQARRLAATLAGQLQTQNTPESLEGFIAAAYERILCREPTSEERAICLDFLREQAARLAEPAALAAFTSGGENAVKPSTDPHQRARENLVHVLFNHNDFLTVR